MSEPGIVQQRNTTGNKTSKRERITELSSVTALAFSFLALTVGAYQARLMNAQTQLMQSQSRASVWPYLSIGYSINDQGEKRGYTWEISNDGVGPARIQSVVMSVDNKSARNWGDVFHALFGNDPVDATYSQIFGRVLAPNTNRDTTIEAVHLTNLAQAKIFYAEQNRLQMEICYCSVYNECWVARRQDPQVEPVDHCTTLDKVQFEQHM